MVRLTFAAVRVIGSVEGSTSGIGVWLVLLVWALSVPQALRTIARKMNRVIRSGMVGKRWFCRVKLVRFLGEAAGAGLRWQELTVNTHPIMLCVYNKYCNL